MTKDETIYRMIKSDREGGFRILLDAYQKPVYYFIRRMVVVHFFFPLSTLFRWKLHRWKH